MFHYTKAVFRVVPRILATYFFFIKRWSKHVEKHPREKRFACMRKLSDKIVKAMSVDLHIFGLENIPTDSNFFLVSNHMSAFDPLPLIASYE